LGLFGPPKKPTDRLKAMMIRLINRTLEEDISYSIENPAPSGLWAGATTREWLESKSLRPGQVLRWTNDMGVKGLRPSRRGSGGDKLSNQRWIDKRLPVGHQASVIQTPDRVGLLNQVIDINLSMKPHDLAEARIRCIKEICKLTQDTMAENKMVMDSLPVKGSKIHCNKNLWP